MASVMVLALVACQQAADDSNIMIDNGGNAEAANAVIEALPPNDSSPAASGKSAAAAPTDPAPSPKLPTSIPAQFHGRWGINPADCSSTRGDAKGLLTINDARLTFYESRGTLDKVLSATANSFDARYGFSGEGQSWDRTERLTLVHDRLERRTDAEPDQEPPVRLTYMRCGK
ncbi:MAG: hypothetical protein ABIS38_07490 [Sphingomicrobium sp.]